MKISWTLESVYIPLILFLVVCGVGDVIETFMPVIVLTNVDLPAEGLPITDTVAAFMPLIIPKTLFKKNLKNT